MELVKSLECPFCGTKGVNKEEFARRTGVEIERTLKMNGELKMVLQLGMTVMEGQKRTGQDMFDKQKLLDLLKDEHKMIEEKHKEVEENRKNIAKEQKETLAEIEKQRKDIEDRRRLLEETAAKHAAALAKEKEEVYKLKEEVSKAEQVKMPEEVVKQIKELQGIANAQNTEVKDLLSKLIYNVKSSGTLQENLVFKRLKSLNTGDKLEPLGGPDQEDILIGVEDSTKLVGKIKIDTKKVERWDKNFVEKMTKYLKANGIEFGMIATTAMPKEAAGSDFHWDGNILIVHERIVEGAYLVARYLLIKNNQYNNEHAKQINLLKENEKKFEVIKKVLDNSNARKFLTSITQEVAKSNKKLDDFSKYTQKALNSLVDCNVKITKQVEAALDSDKELQMALSGA